jgi:hypothetical protein
VLAAARGNARDPPRRVDAADPDIGVSRIDACFLIVEPCCCPAAVVVS